jgi:hypothetical protein
MASRDAAASLEAEQPDMARRVASMRDSIGFMTFSPFISSSIDIDDFQGKKFPQYKKKTAPAALHHLL